MSTTAYSKCQSDILEMILDNFTIKLNQKVFNSQAIIHVNDLKMLTGQAA